MNTCKAQAEEILLAELIKQLTLNLFLSEAEQIHKIGRSRECEKRPLLFLCPNPLRRRNLCAGR